MIKKAKRLTAAQRWRKAFQEVSKEEEIDDKFLSSILKLFYDNTKKVSYSYGEEAIHPNKEKQYVTLKVYRPFVMKQNLIQLSGFRVVIECSSLNAILRVYEMTLGRSVTFEDSTDSIETVYIQDSKEYKLIRQLITNIDRAKEQETIAYSELVKQEFINQQLTFENPMTAYVEYMNKQPQEKELSAYSREPEILSFDEEEDFEEDR